MAICNSFLAVFHSVPTWPAVIQAMHTQELVALAWHCSDVQGSFQTAVTLHMGAKQGYACLLVNV